MKRTVGARYLPLAAIVAVQLLIVAVAPSTMQDQSVEAGAGGVDSSVGTPGDGANDFTDPETGEPVDDGSGEVAIDAGGGGDTGGGGDAGDGRPDDRWRQRRW